MLKKISLILLLVFVLSGCTNDIGSANSTTNIGGSFSDAQWLVVDKFNGYQTNLDPTKVSNGANPQGQNTTVNEGDRISTRNLGYEIFPDTLTATSSEVPINSVHTFRLRDGSSILMRTYSTVVEFYDETGDSWETLKTGLTTGLDYGFADFNINTDLQSYVYFGNNTDNGMRWSGDYSPLNGAVSAGDSEITVDDTTGFLLTGSIIYCGAEIAYGSITSNTFNLSASTTVACIDNEAVAQAVTTDAARPKGDIYFARDNRLFIAGISSTTQAVYFSEYGDATNFVGADLVIDSTATAPGIFNLGEGGGAVTGIVADESSIYFFTRSSIHKATISDSLYTIANLKPFDGKSQTIGAISQKAIFTGGNAVYFITQDNQIMELLRVESFDYPQVRPISTVIKPTVDAMNFDDASGIVFKDKAYFAVKQDTDVTENNVVLVWNIKQKMWDSPILGWNVSDFTIYNDGESEELYFGDNNDTNIYQVNNTPIDDVYGVTASWRSKQYNLSGPQEQKQIVDMFIEGYIKTNTALTISLLLDEDGYTQSFSAELLGTETDYIYDSSSFNVFGLNSFGTERFGTNADFSGLKKFRIYLGKDFNPGPFYNISLDFESDGEDFDWEILSYGFRWRVYSQPEKRQLYKSFK